MQDIIQFNASPKTLITPMGKLRRHGKVLGISSAQMKACSSLEALKRLAKAHYHAIARQEHPDVCDSARQGLVRESQVLRAKHWSYAAIARRLHISTDTAKRWSRGESGRPFSASHARKFRRAARSFAWIDKLQCLPGYAWYERFPLHDDLEVPWTMERRETMAIGDGWHICYLH